MNNNEIENKYRKGDFIIVTEQARISLNEISNFFNKKEFHLSNVIELTNDQKSQLIENLLMNISIVPAYAIETDYSKYKIINGSEKIIALNDFFDNKFALSGLSKYWKELEGKKYNDLPSCIQNGIKRRYFPYYVFLFESSCFDDDFYNFVSERINVQFNLSNSL